MAKAERTEVFDVPVEKFYQAVIDYKAYPQFAEGVKTVDIVDSNADSPTVKFGISIIKEISYTLKMKHKKNEEVSWSLVSGDLMKVNNGRWTMKDLGGARTEVTYSLEVELKGFLPGLGMIEKTLVNVNLPQTMKSFASRAAKL